MSPKAKIFITGATGYIGGSVLSRLLIHPELASYQITALVRSRDKADKLKSLGVTAVHGSFEDFELLENLAADADYIISAADSDDLEAIKALLLGARRHNAETGTVPVFIHTSGTGVLTDDAVGNFSTDIVYDDMNLEEIESLPDTAPHRNVDLELVKADGEDLMTRILYVKTYIVLPSMIYGIATGVLAEAEIQNVQSIQIPTLIRASLDRARAGMVGQGKNIWVNVHIDDIADLYIVLWDAVRRTANKIPHGREGFYFGENGENSLFEIGKTIGQALVALGKSNNQEPTTFTAEEVQKYLPGGNPRAWSTNSRCRSNRSRSIGWIPKKDTTDFLANFHSEVEFIIKQGIRA